jgi:endonuclease/exonuclease/phosphatase (EEP) superfamily protein YafD
MASPNLTLPGSRTEAGVFTALLSPPDHGSAMLSDAAEPLILSRKAMLRCETPTRRAGTSLMCLNIHSLNFKLGLSGFRDQLERLLEPVGAHLGPVILSGDFNTWSRRRTDLLLAMAESLHLRRVDFPADAGREWWRPRLILDHVFHSHPSLGLKPGSAKILRSIRSSDHAPLLADFILD